jgi:MFS family permease
MFGRGLGDAYVVFVLPLEREFGWTRSQLTSVYSIYLLVHGFTSPLVGMLFDRLGPRWVYATGMACLGAAFFLAAGLVSLWQFYLFIGALVGVGVSLNGMVPGSALLARWYREKLATAIGVAFSAVGVGTIVFVPLAQYLVAHYDWRFAYRVLGAGILLLVPIVAFALPWKKFYAGRHHATKLRDREAGWTLRAALRSPLYWGLCQVFFGTAAAMFSVVVQLVAFFVDVGFSPIAGATAYGMLGMMSAMSVMASGFLAERFGYRQTVTATFIGTAAGMSLLFALTLIPSMFLLALFVPTFGLCMGVRGPIVSSVSTKYFAGPHAATIYGSIYASNALGAAFGSLMGGLLHDLTGGYRVGLVVAMGFVALASTPFWTVPALRHFR